jgi:hypothetical protein
MERDVARRRSSPTPRLFVVEELEPELVAELEAVARALGLDAGDVIEAAMRDRQGRK